MGQLTINLHAPEFGLFERLGVGGMALAIDAANQDQTNPLGEVTARFNNACVMIEWPENLSQREALRTILHYAWQNPRDGVMYLPGVHRGAAAHDPVRRLVEHKGISETYLAGAVSKNRTDQQRVVGQFGDKTLVAGFKVAQTLKYHDEFDTLFDKRGDNRDQLRDVMGLQPSTVFKRWLLPGITSRRPTGIEEWTGTGLQALALFYMPSCALYFGMQRDWVIVIPEVADLQKFVKYRSGITQSISGDYQVANPAEAALRAASLLYGLGSRFVAVVMGKVLWSKDPTKKGLLTVPPSQDIANLYQIVQQHLPPRYYAAKQKADSEKKDDPGSDLFTLKLAMTPRGLIAKNIVNGLPWYSNLHEFPTESRDELDFKRKREAKSPDGGHMSIERIWFDLLKRSSKQLRNIMAEIDKQYPNPDEIAFREAFTNTLRRLNRQILEDGRRFGRSQAAGFKKIRNKQDEILRELTRAKNFQLFATYMGKLLCVGGRSSIMHRNLDAVFSMITEARWRQAHHLALLCLATYGSDNVWVGELTKDANSTRLKVNRTSLDYAIYTAQIGGKETRAIVTKATDAEFGIPEEGTVEVSLESQQLNWHPNDIAKLAGKNVSLVEIAIETDALEEEPVAAE